MIHIPAFLHNLLNIHVKMRLAQEFPKEKGMTVQLPIIEFSRKQRALWEHVGNLWALSQSRDEAQIRATLHPRYVGCDMDNGFGQRLARRTIKMKAEQVAALDGYSAGLDSHRRALR